jgi:hypothetical protein
LGQSLISWITSGRGRAEDNSNPAEVGCRGRRVLLSSARPPVTSKPRAKPFQASSAMIPISTDIAQSIAPLVVSRRWSISQPAGDGPSIARQKQNAAAAVHIPSRIVRTRAPQTTFDVAVPIVASKSELKCRGSCRRGSHGARGISGSSFHGFPQYLTAM